MAEPIGTREFILFFIPLWIMENITTIIERSLENQFLIYEKR